jgi:hypothetical protein
MLVKIDGANYVRDTASMAIMPTDQSEKNEYYAKVQMMKLQKTEINILRQEINNIKSDVGEIKALLCQLIGKE